MFGLLLGECCLLPMLGFSQIILFDIFNVMTKAEWQSDDQHDKSWLLSRRCESVSLGKMASEWIYLLCESDTGWAVKADCWVVLTQFLESNSKTLGRYKKNAVCVCLVTCRIHSESSKALRKESSESDEEALGAHARSIFLKEALTCRVSAKSTGTSSQFREESTLRPCGKRESSVSSFVMAFFTSTSLVINLLISYCATVQVRRSTAQVFYKISSAHILHKKKLGSCPMCVRHRCFSLELYEHNYYLTGSENSVGLLGNWANFP